VHPDRKSQPIEKISQGIGHFQFPHRQESCGTEQDTQHSVAYERSHTHEKYSGKVLRFFVDHVTRGVAEAKEAHVINLQPEKLAEEQMRGFMHNYAGKVSKAIMGPGIKNIIHSILLALFLGEPAFVFLRADDFPTGEPVTCALDIFLETFLLLKIALELFSRCLQHFLRLLPESRLPGDCILAGQGARQCRSGIRSWVLLPLLLRDCEEGIIILRS
jgi:hypothetical protein